MLTELRFLSSLIIFPIQTNQPLINIYTVKISSFRSLLLEIYVQVSFLSMISPKKGQKQACKSGLLKLQEMVHSQLL